jgi:hypothetical protein
MSRVACTLGTHFSGKTDMVKLGRCVTIAATGVVLVLGVGGPLEAQARDVATLRWMSGCWELRTGSRVTHEQWMAPLGSLMMGMSRTVSRDTVREFEVLRIEVRNGMPTYVAMPGGQKETLFVASVVTDTAVVFDNPAHDFPQRIEYRRVGADSLSARIEGTTGGRLRRIDFPLRRVSCIG